MFATGSGRADKHDMIEAARQHFPGAREWGRIGPDEADALWLAAMGTVYLGEPVVNLPKAQAAVVWARWDGKDKNHKRGEPKILWPVMGVAPPPALAPPDGSLFGPAELAPIDVRPGA